MLKWALFLVCQTFSLGASSFDSLEVLPQACEKDEVPFVKCNEAGQNDLINKLKRIPLSQKGVHIGWSLEFNFRLIVARKPQLAIICDINKRTLEFLDVFEQVIVISEDVDDFFEKLNLALSPYISYFFNELFRKFDDTMTSYSEWLKEDHFRTLKQMYVEKRIKHLILNVLDEDNRFSRLAQWIQENGYTVDTLYASNIYNWVSNNQTFFSNLLTLIDKQTLFIDADYYTERKKVLSLRMTRGRLPFVMLP